MQRLPALVLALLPVIPRALWAGPQPVVAVFDLENRAKLKSSDVSALTDYVATRVAEGGRYRIVPRAELQDALREKKNESYRACYDESCQIEVGREIAAQKTLSSKVSRIGSTCIVTVQLYDLAQAASERASTAKGGCKVEDVLGLLDKALEPFAAMSAANGPVAAPTAQPTTQQTSPAPSPGPKPMDTPTPTPAPTEGPHVTVPAGWAPTPPSNLAERGDEVMAQRWETSQRSRQLLVVEIQGLERLQKNSPANSPDGAQLILRLATTYGELERSAGRDKDAKAAAIASKAREQHIRWLAVYMQQYPSASNVDLVMHLLSKALVRSGDLARARKLAYELIKRYPQSKYIPAAYLMFGKLFYQNDQAELAEASIREVLKYPDPGYQVFGRYWLGWIAVKKRDLQSAADQLSQARSRARELPNNTTWKAALVSELDKTLSSL